MGVKRWGWGEEVVRGSEEVGEEGGMVVIGWGEGWWVEGERWWVEGERWWGGWWGGGRRGGAKCYHIRASV